MESELTEAVGAEEEYPVGELSPLGGLKPIKVYFMHYETFAEAKTKWDERKQRINWGKIFVVSTFCYPGEIKDFSEELVEQWNKVPYKKVMIVDRNYGFGNEFVIAKPEACQEYAWLLWAPNEEDPLTRVFNQFDFVRFLDKKCYFKAKV